MAVAKGEDVENMGYNYFLKMVYMIQNMVATYCEIFYVKIKKNSRRT